MKKYGYHEPTENGDAFIIKTEQEILELFWGFWKSKMERKYGKGHVLITEENCIEDWVTVHWAEEL